MATLATLVVSDPYDVDWHERVIVLGFAFGALVVAFWLGFTYFHDAMVELMGLIPLSMFAAGKFLPLWGIGDSHFNPWQLGLVIWAMDTCTILVIVYALEGIYRIRPIKHMLARVQNNASLVLAAYPRIRRGAVVGVVLFVLFPVAGTGALAGGFLGILLGLDRFVLMSAVSFGGLAGGMLMAFAAVNFGEAMQRLRAMQSDPVIKWLTIGVIVASLVALFFWLNQVYRRAIEAARQEKEQMSEISR